MRGEERRRAVRAVQARHDRGRRTGHGRSGASDRERRSERGRADPLRADAGGGRAARRVVPVRPRDGPARVEHASRGARRADARGGASPGIRGGVGMPRPARRSDRSGAARRGRMGQRSARHRPPEARARPAFDGAPAGDEGAVFVVARAGRHGASGAAADGRGGLLGALRPCGRRRSRARPPRTRGALPGAPREDPPRRGGRGGRPASSRGPATNRRSGASCRRSKPNCTACR